MMSAPTYKPGEIIRLEPATNGGWIVWIGSHILGDKPSTMAAYSNTHDMLDAVSAMLAARDKD